MTYKKPIKGFQATTLMSEGVRAEDTDIKREGSYAIEAFEAHKIVKAYIPDPETGNPDIETLIPFHAIKLVEYGTFTENTEKADAYCGGGTEPIGEVWYTGTLGECQNEVAAADLTATDNANPQDLFDNSDDYLVYVNGKPMPTVEKQGNGKTRAFEMTWTRMDTDGFNTYQGLDTKKWEGATYFVLCPTDITNVEITVAKK